MGKVTHGMTDTPLHRIWLQMRLRCRNKSRKTWKNYGARGIDLSPEWEKFENFYEDMKDGFIKGEVTIERINNDLGYSKENCKWIPRKEQSRNRRKGEIWNLSKEPTSRNTSGYRGVCWNPRNNNWVATTAINGKHQYIGSYTKPEEAYKAYLRVRHKCESP